MVRAELRVGTTKLTVVIGGFPCRRVRRAGRGSRRWRPGPPRRRRSGCGHAGARVPAGRRRAAMAMAAATSSHLPDAARPDEEGADHVRSRLPLSSAGAPRKSVTAATWSRRPRPRSARRRRGSASTGCALEARHRVDEEGGEGLGLRRAELALGGHRRVLQAGGVVGDGGRAERGGLAHDQPPALAGAGGDVHVRTGHALDLVILVNATEDVDASGSGLAQLLEHRAATHDPDLEVGDLLAGDAGGLDDVLRALVGHEASAPDDRRACPPWPRPARRRARSPREG